MSSQREGYTCGFVFVNFEAPFLEPLFIESRPRWRVEDAIMGSAWDANSAVSSEMSLGLSLMILVNRQYKWRTAGVRGHCLGVCQLLLKML